MITEYTYEIIAVDQAARCMEVVYSSGGRQAMHIGARLPYVGESLEGVIHMYAPLAYWREQETAVVVPNLGGGSINVPVPEPIVPNYEEQRKAAYREESDPIFFKWQRGEATEQEWIDKIAEIKARFPEDGSGLIAPSIPVTVA